MRLDKYLVEKNLVASRERAKLMIEQGKVWLNGAVVKRATREVTDDDMVDLRGQDSIPWVSRGGLKLEKALQEFGVDLNGQICLDIGACTGGFTEVMLARGAKKVYALDVGHDQLAERLKQDERVVNLERVNIRDVNQDFFADEIDFIAIDVSFISLKKVLPKAVTFLRPKGIVVALIKPHFEVGKKQIKKGYVTNPILHDQVVANIRRLGADLGLGEIGFTTAPLLDEKRNQEFLIGNVKKRNWMLEIGDWKSEVRS